MKRYRWMLMKCLYPRGWFTALMALASAVGLVFVFQNDMQMRLPGYVLYPVSAYALVIVVVRLVSLCRVGRARLQRNAFYCRYSRDLDFKVFVSVHVSLGITLFYCAVKAAAGIYYRSAWLGSVAFYYIVLAMMRFLLLRQARRRRVSRIKAFREYRLCGCLLLVLTFSLAVMGFWVIYGDEAKAYPGFMIYGAAGFAFYNLIKAVFNLVRYAKLDNPIYSAGKILSLASALVSLFFLQTALLSAFGDGGAWQRAMNAATGAAVFAMIAGMAVYMIRRGTRAVAQI